MRRDNFQSIANSIKHELLSGSCNNIMIHATERTICRIEDKFKHDVLVLLANDENTKNTRRDRKKKYYVIRVQKESKITV